MRLSAPIFRLKKQARALSCKEGIPLHQALDRVAQKEGFERWSLLSSKLDLRPTASQILDQFQSGDLVLLAARPQQGKTTLGLSLVAEALRQGQPSAFFTLFHTEEEVQNRLLEFGVDPLAPDAKLMIDTSDEISGPHIVDQLVNAARDTLVVVDYLQVLDQKRDTPDLNAQVQMLKAFAQSSGTVLVLISQVSRAFDPTTKSMPDLEDVHLPNPVDLSAFSKTCFLSEGVIQLDQAA